MNTIEARTKQTLLPSILIQHPACGAAYYIPEEHLEVFEVSGASLLSIGPETVTFSVAEDDVIEDMPAFNQTESVKPDVLVRFPARKRAFFIPSNKLQEFKIDQPKASFGDHYISFIMPAGMEMVDEIPLYKRGMLQSNTG